MSIHLFVQEDTSCLPTGVPLGMCVPVCAPVSLPVCVPVCVSLHVNTSPPLTPSVNQSHRKSLGSSEGESESRPGKYCCVYLPDGTASLALARPGLTIRDMLAGICEKRGLSLPDIKVYLVGNEQKALVLDQDCTVLADQEVRLENRITFELELAALERVVRISAKPTKRLQDALQPILAKHGLSPQQVALRLVRSSRWI